MTTLKDKILSRSEAAELSRQLRITGQEVVVTNGCFDIVHAGHVTFLEEARSRGDHLFVAVNADDSVSALKGPTRPINKLEARMTVVAALESVTAVVAFHETLATEILRELGPTLYVKGGDYQIEDLNQQEVAAVVESGGHIAIIKMVQGFSTTGIIEKSRQ